MISGKTTTDQIEGKAPDGASKGQVLVMFALFATAMIGMLGMAVDLGFAFSERRTMQNAADLASIAGARAVARYTPDNPVSAFPAIQQIVNGNQMGDTAATIEECSYLSNDLTVIGGCEGSVPSDATGVRVRVSETHNTFFIGVVPGGPSSVTTGAVAEARVERHFRAGTDAPFLVCGWDTKLESGGNLSILLSNNAVNPAALNQTFMIHGSTIAKCGMAGTTWKGIAENRQSQANNDGRDINTYWTARTGDVADATRVEVNGIEGCAEGTSVDAADCIMLLPVGTNGAHGFPALAPNPRQLYVVKMLAFRVTSCGVNCHSGTLIDDYSTFAGSVSDWCRDCGGVTVIKLRE